MFVYIHCLIIKTWQYICDDNSGKPWWILIILHIWKREWMPSASTLFTYLFYMWRKFDVTVTFMTLMSCDSVCCMCSEASSSRWLMTHLVNTLANLCPCQLWTFWTYLVTVSLFSLYLMNFVFNITLHAVRNILRVHYKSMKCNVSFSQGSVSTLFRCEHVFHICVKMFFLLTAVQKLF